MAKIMLIDDELAMVTMIAGLLRGQGHDVISFTEAEPALEAMEATAPELVITDLYLNPSQPRGLDILSKARSLDPAPGVIVVTAFSSVETAVEAMRKGAFDYVRKPFEMDELTMVVRRALSYDEAVSENGYLRNQIQKKFRLNQIIGESVKMKEVLNMIARVADTDSTILILGESGTGKELVAKALHYNSRREYAPFVPVNCSALPETLLESELFGHRKGAFTGAIYDKKGLFQQAHGGTIFLDEIGSMSPMLQSRLLRALQEREIRRVGDNVAIHVNVRILAATNEPLEENVKTGTFREDLYYRLNVISITLPPLRERIEDLPLLVNHFLKKKVHARTGKSFAVGRQAFEVLCEYDWPGNVRELENAIERACALAEDHVIRLRDLPPRLQQFATQKHGAAFSDEQDSPARADEPPAIAPDRHAPVTEESPDGAIADQVVPLKPFLRNQELAYLRRVLSQAGGDKEKAARMLGVSLATFYRKIGEFPDE